MPEPQFTSQQVATLRTAAEAGQVKVQLTLGRLLKAYPELGDTGEWAKWLYMAAERGSGDACWELADVMLEQKDFKRAHVVMTLGATLASPQCLRELGLMQLNGIGIPADPQQAFSLFTRAAKCNDAIGQYQLGRCYAKGLGTTANVPLAREWFNKAASQGDKNAIAALKAIAVGGFKAAATLP